MSACAIDFGKLIVQIQDTLFIPLLMRMHVDLGDSIICHRLFLVCNFVSEPTVHTTCLQLNQF